MWDQAKPCDLHPYLELKGVPSYGLKQYKEALVIPAYSRDWHVQTLQFISPDGQKVFLKGGKKKGGFYCIGREHIDTAPVINYAEGYATAASYHRDTGEPVTVSFDAGNLPPVAEVMFSLYPQAKHVFIADFDESKTGEKYAIQAAQLIQKRQGRAEVLMPQSPGITTTTARRSRGSCCPSCKRSRSPTPSISSAQSAAG